MRALFLYCLSLSASVWAQSSAVDAYVASESPIAKAGVLANIGPSGSKSSGAKTGVVIASPSSTNPDYLFTWTRDSSLVFQALIDQYTLGLDTTLRTEIDNFVSAETTQQQVSNPSGSVSSGGLGEPKFNIDLSAFTGAWGRPQRDGPALRSTALITYANWLIANGNTSYVSSTLWPVIKLDLGYVVSFWNQTGWDNLQSRFHAAADEPCSFDLWEEVSSSSFFTTAVQHRSLREGAALATALGDTSATQYTTQAANILCFLQSYWNPSGLYMTANTGGGRSGKDANTALASIHTFDAAAGCDAVTFQPCSDKALSSLKVYVDAFRSIYTINSGIASNAAVATGRYPEDSYMGGNPWYLTTAAVAEQLYDAIIVWNRTGTIEVTSISLAFFQQFSSSVTTGVYASSTTTYSDLLSAVQTFADGFLAINAKYTPSDGGLAEQYSRSNGAPLSAVDLTWSYAATLTAFSARAGVVSASWGASGLTVPSSCSTSSGGSGGTVSVTFNEFATTVFGENIYLTGSIDALQDWSPDTALLLNTDNYPTWSITLNLPASTTFQYKYIRKFNGAVTWESDPNRQFTTPASGSSVINDSWR
ncbi:related to Glucoamylase [Armillaria ostoyae]|uniref:Glucoamylase n=1 Tax=Armillaria ostoyae TaxID=47428 RepID=A0A284RG90_ARMOS|nr:related to Glucoamylase [Armillaria ostoyae]